MIMNTRSACLWHAPLSFSNSLAIGRLLCAHLRRAGKSDRHASRVYGPSRSEVYQGAQLALAFPPRPVLGVQAHEGHRGFDRLLSRLEFEHSVAADDFLGLGVWPVDHRELPAGAAHSYAAGAGAQAAGLHQ